MHLSNVVIRYDHLGYPQIEASWGGIRGSLAREPKAQLRSYGAFYLGGDWESVTAVTLPPSGTWGRPNEAVIRGATMDPDVLEDFDRIMAYVARHYQGVIPDRE